MAWRFLCGEETGPALSRRLLCAESAARSPIGRAAKGSLVDMRPDDLTVHIVRAALNKVPQLDPTDIGDLMQGRGRPGGESGFNTGRVVAVELGYDHLPGCTNPRYRGSSLQTTRKALHGLDG